MCRSVSCKTKYSANNFVLMSIYALRIREFENIAVIKDANGVQLHKPCNYWTAFGSFFSYTFNYIDHYYS